MDGLAGKFLFYRSQLFEGDARVILAGPEKDNDVRRGIGQKVIRTPARARHLGILDDRAELGVGVAPSPKTDRQPGQQQKYPASAITAWRHGWVRFTLAEVFGRELLYDRVAWQVLAQEPPVSVLV
jgi:hypothetical protein